MRDAQPGVVAYLACHTQWQVGGLGQRTGLRYEGCMALLDRYLQRWRAEQSSLWGELEVTDLMQDLQVIESAVLNVDAERAAKPADA